MTTITEAALAASVLVGLLSIPSVSQTTTPTGAFSGDMPSVSGSDTAPKEVTTTTGPALFHRTVETAFSTFETEISDSEADIVLEDTGSRLEVHRSPSSTTWMLTTPTGTLEVAEKGSQKLETVSTPAGTLERVIDNGRVREDFTGANREEVEEAREQLRNEMEEMKKEMEERSVEMRNDQYRATLSINVSADSPEYAVIRNSGSSPVDVEGWTLSDNAGTHVLGDVSVPANGELYVYTEETGEVEPVDEEAVNVYDSNLAWNQDSDTATLEDSEGNEVESYSY